MGLADRDYMKGKRGGGGGFGGGGGGGVRIGGFRGFVPPNRWRATTWLIVLNVAVAVVGWAFWTAFAQSARGGGGGEPMFVMESAQELSRSAADRGGPFGVREDEQIVPTGRRPLRPSSISEGAKDLYNAETGDAVGRQLYLLHPDPLLLYGHFSTYTAFSRLEVWRFITFQFLHAGFWHLALNMIALFYFGYVVEQRLGSRKRFLAFYLACGVCGAALYLMLNLLGHMGVPLPGVLDVRITTPLIGASAGVFGVLLAAARFVGHGTIYLFFVLPMPLKLGVYLLFGLSLVNLLFGGFNQGGEAAHVGGALAGMYLARRPEQLDDFFDVLGGKKGKGGRKAGTRKKARRGKGAGPKPLTKSEEEKLDRILGKVGTRGMSALTDDEKAFLESAREKKGR
jgi:membrane associated rhomboid family serine protease